MSSRVIVICCDPPVTLDRPIEIDPVGAQTPSSLRHVTNVARPGDHGRRLRAESVGQRRPDGSPDVIVIVAVP